MSAAAINDRRMRAVEAGWDAAAGAIPNAVAGIDAAVETATRVRITPEIVLAFTDYPGHWPAIEAPLRAAFEAAGFEVEE